MTIEPSTGIVFPADADGTRSTTQTGAHILSAALQPLHAGHAQAAQRETRWRRTYPQYFRHLVEDALVSPQAALASARAGLDAAWETLHWQTPSGSSSLRAALASADGPLRTRTIQGAGAPEPAPWTVPLWGEELHGARLAAQIGDWEQRGILEPSAAQALRRCQAHPEWFDLSDRTLVLLGAGSEAGPLRWLAQWRAHIVAVDVARAPVWQRILGVVRQGNARMSVPVRGDMADATGDGWVDHAGADLLTEAPAIASYLNSLGVPLDIAALAYLDGERHVRVAMGMDMVMAAACAARGDTTLAFLATPTDVFAVHRETAQAAMAAFGHRPLATRALQSSLRLAAGERFFQPNITPGTSTAAPGRYAVVDSLVLEQGPNYALAKRLQQWRALVARADGHRVSLNVAPSTATSSVVKNLAFAAGLAGADSFGIEVFEPATTNALMAALWVHDLRCDASAANPHTPLAHPFELFMDNACHGGLWRCAYLPRTALPFAAALGWVRQRFQPD